MLRAQILGVNPTPSDTCEKQVKTFREGRTELGWAQLDLRIHQLKIGQSLVPVFLKIRRFGIDSLVVPKFREWFVECWHRF